ncbi:MAG: hypothetical protein KW806_00515 [Candidatus Yanofskybacteria bacterium]|nr:hypothetical protein [Candidatus Yanofskybacteria bacterium]
MKQKKDYEKLFKIMSRRLLTILIIILLALGAKFLPFGSVPSDWQTYQNNDFGFSFRYPANAHICDTRLHPEETYILSLAIDFKSNCTSTELYGLTTADIYINIEKDVDKAYMRDNQTFEHDFFMGFDPDIRDTIKQLSPDLGFKKVDGLRAYGGVIKRDTSTNSEYLLGISHNEINGSFWDRHYHEHKNITDKIVRSLKFDSQKYPR